MSIFIEISIYSRGYLDKSQYFLKSMQNYLCQHLFLIVLIVYMTQNLYLTTLVFNSFMS